MAAFLPLLSETFDLDPLIDEYAIMPQVSASLFGSCGDSAAEDDIGIAAAEHKIAISIEAALVIYRCAFRRLRHSNCQASASALSRAVLLCSADCASAWVCREGLVRSGAAGVAAELDFNALLLRTNHKSGEAWAFRRYLLATGLAGMTPDCIAAQGDAEQKLVEELARKYDHHYYAWNHWALVDRLVRFLMPPDATILNDSFPKLVHATPSHYGLFHHRIVKLSKQLHLPERATALDKTETALPHRALELHATERQLAATLITTFPYLEAPWAFRLQLFAALLEAVVATAPNGCPPPEAILKLLSLWRSEMAFAVAALAEALAGEEEGRKRLCERCAQRFQVHLLQELAMYATSWRSECLRSRRGLECSDANASSEAAEELAKFGTEGLGTIETMLAGEVASTAILRSIREDLSEAVCVEAC